VVAPARGSAGWSVPAENPENLGRLDVQALGAPLVPPAGAWAAGAASAGNQRQRAPFFRRGVLHNWPDTGPGARARKRADMRQVSC
jgi:hypothetical protein